MPPRPPPAHKPVPADFVQSDDYADRYLSDVAAALPRAPLTVVESIWWYVTGRGVRARNRLQEIVGRRLGFARPNRLRPVPKPPVPSVRPSCAVIVPVTDSAQPESVGASLASVPDGIETLVVSAGPLEPSSAMRCLELPGATGIAALVNGAAQACDHDLVMVLHPGHVLLEEASEAVAAAFAEPRVEAAYPDELLALPGLTLPLLKPDFDEELLLGVDYVGDFLVARRERFLALGGYGEAHEGALARDFLLRLSASGGTGAIAHIQGPVHGRDLRRSASEGVVSAPRIEAIRDLPDPPTVSVIVPTRDRADLLAPCLKGLLEGTDYPELEVVVADNDSSEPETAALFAAHAGDPRLRVAPMPGPFNFSRINNDAVALARGSVLVFLNNDIEVLEPGWLHALVREAVRPEIGAVGAKLLYPGGLVQHAGVVLGLIGGPAGHAFHLFKDGHPGYLHMLETTRRVSAVTAACLAVTREKFEAMGGFDAEAFPVALNDVDLCLRLDRAGYRNLYVPAARLLHKESASRPNDMRPDQRARYERELAAFSARWADRLARDPWYNPGHGQANADFSVPEWTGAWPPRAP